MKYNISVGAVKEQKTINKIFLAAVVSLVAVLSITATTLAAGPYSAIPETNPAFEPSGRNSIQNVNNNDLRFGRGGRIVVPGNAGVHANEKSAVAEHSTGETIVDPRGAF